MITILSDGTSLRVHLTIPPDINAGKNQHYVLTRIIGGDERAVFTLAERLQRQLNETLAEIRRKAYAQGARDRKQKAKRFSSSFDTTNPEGGCWQ